MSALKIYSKHLYTSLQNLFEALNTFRRHENTGTSMALVNQKNETENN